MITAAAIVARADARMLWRSRIIVTAVAAFALLMAMAAERAVRTYRQEVVDAARLERAGQGVDERGASHTALERGTFAVLPPSALTALAVGQADVYPRHFRITARLRDGQLAGDQLQHPLALLNGSLDVAFLVLFFVPLLVIAVSHDLIASDRTSGTLRLLIVQGASLPSIVAGRLLVRAGLLVLLVVGGGAATLALTDARALLEVRAWWWLVASVAYLLFWFGLAVLVNAAGVSAAGNALRLSAAWLFLTVLVPFTTNTVVGLVDPVPSRVALSTAIRDASRSAIEQGSRTLGRYLEDHPSTGTGEEGMRQFYMLQDLRDREVARRVQPLLARFAARVERQAAVTSLAQYASPTLLGQLVLTEIAGTGGRRAARFAAQAETYQRGWQRHFSAEVLAADRWPGDPPPFVYLEEDPWAVVRRTCWQMAVLLAAACTLFGLGWRRLHAVDRSA